MLFCVVQLKLTYSNPNRAFKVCEMFKEWFCQFHSSIISIAKRGSKPRPLESQYVTLPTTPCWVSSMGISFSYLQSHVGDKTQFPPACWNQSEALEKEHNSGKERITIISHGPDLDRLQAKLVPGSSSSLE